MCDFIFRNPSSAGRLLHVGAGGGAGFSFEHVGNGESGLTHLHAVKTDARSNSQSFGGGAPYG